MFEVLFVQLSKSPVSLSPVFTDFPVKHWLQEFWLKIASEVQATSLYSPAEVDVAVTAVVFAAALRVGVAEVPVAFNETEEPELETDGSVASCAITENGAKAKVEKTRSETALRIKEK